MTHHQHFYNGPWSSDSQLTPVVVASLSPYNTRRSHSEDPQAMYQNTDFLPEKGSRTSQLRNRVGESHSARRPSTSSLSNAMGTPQMGRRADAMSSKSSPASDESLQEMQMAQYSQGSAFDMFSLQYPHPLDRGQDISMLSPPHGNPLSLPDHTIGNHTLHSPYTETPPTTAADLPSVSSYSMHGQQFAVQAGYSQQAPHRSSAFNATQRSSVPSSAPHADGATFSTGHVMPKSSPPNVLGQFPFNVSPPLYTMPSEDSEDHASILTHVEQLKAQNAELQAQVMRLQSQLQNRHSVPSVPTTMPPLSSSMEASWEKRTQARTRKFCAPNRAGNSLCSWHDTRRERRAHPPRMAPEGVLNCGCNSEEALFEESLARNGVGSYHPGDSVRIDPVIRNALLNLLKKRYNYRDGDFEINPRTGTWVEGEGHEKWERELLHSGNGPKAATRK